MPGFGRGMGRRGGFGGGYGGFGRGRGYGRGAGFGPDGTCVCQSCGYEMPHQRGVPCYTLKCPMCGGPMIRKDTMAMGNYFAPPSPVSPSAKEEDKKESYKYTKPPKPKVDETKCVGCAECIRFCPFNAIELKDGIAHIDPNKCRDCGRCIDICPVGAIS